MLLNDIDDDSVLISIVAMEKTCRMPDNVVQLINTTATVTD